MKFETLNCGFVWNLNQSLNKIFLPVALPEYCLMSSYSCSRVLKTCMPRPRFRLVALKIQKFLPAKCDKGIWIIFWDCLLSLGSEKWYFLMKLSIILISLICFSTVSISKSPSFSSFWCNLLTSSENLFQSRKSIDKWFQFIFPRKIIDPILNL